jgi:hypothetical protein
MNCLITLMEIPGNCWKNNMRRIQIWKRQDIWKVNAMTERRSRRRKKKDVHAQKSISFYFLFCSILEFFVNILVESFVLFTFQDEATIGLQVLEKEVV